MSQETDTTSLGNRYGMPLPARRQEFLELLDEVKKKGGASHRIENFQGQVVSLPIIRVVVDLPKYRIANGRTSSIQEEWVTLNNKEEDFFSDGDPELYTIQEAQHEILSAMISEEGLLEKFRDSKNKQVEPLLLDENGFVVNGNRRLCCWRSLYHEDPEKYSHFGHVDVVVLDKCDDRELDGLESRLQIERDVRSDYSWHAEAKMFEQKQKLFGYSTNDLARQYGKKPKDIEELFEIRSLGAEYLESRNKKNIWSELKETEHTFKRLNKAMKDQSSIADREVLKELTFNYIDDPDSAGERLYLFIPKLGQHLGPVKERLKKAFPQKAESPVDAEAISAFGGTTAIDDGASDMQLVAQINETRSNLAQAQDIIAATLDSEKSKLSDAKRSNYLTENLQKSQTFLTEAINLGLTPEAKIDGAITQLDALEASILKIRDFIKSRSN
jgi:hypothetical protein